MNALPIVFFVLLLPFFFAFLGPLLFLFINSFSGIDREVIFSGISARILWFNYSQAFLSSVLAGIVGVFFAFVLCELKIFGKKIITKISEITFFLPTLLVVLAIIGVWGNHGWLGRNLANSSLYGWVGILLAHVFLNFSVYLRLVGEQLKRSDRTEEKVALSLGASRWNALLSITLKKIQPAIFQSFILVFVYCSSSFVVLMLLGGGPRFSGVETAIYQAVKVDLDLPLAVSLATIQVLVCVTAHLFYKLPSQPSIASHEGFREKLYFVRSRKKSLVINLIVWIVFGLIVLLPILNLLCSGFSGLPELSIEELKNSLMASSVLGLKVAVLATFLAFSSAYVVHHPLNSVLKKAVNFFSLLPVAISTMVLGVACTLTLRSFWTWEGEFSWGVIFIQSLSCLPIGFRILSMAFSKIELEVYSTAKSLGASDVQVLTHLEMPIVKSALATCFVTSFGISLGEVGALLLFESQGNPTISILIFKLMGKYHFNEAYSIGIVLLILMALVLALKEKWEIYR